MSWRGLLVVAAAGILLPGGFAEATGDAPGDLDPSFGQSGYVRVSVGSNGAGAYAAVVQPDGKIVMAGETLPTAPPPPPPAPPRLSRSRVGRDGGGNEDFVAVRLNADGSLDSTFGSGGIVRTPIDLVPGGSDIARAVALGPDGSIVLAGTARREGSNDFAFVRYTATGELDPTFSGDGIQTIDVDIFDSASGVAVQPDGKVVAVGRPAYGSNSFLAMRLQTDGGLDGSFGSGGVSRMSIGDPDVVDTPEAVALMPDGRIVSAGTADDGYPYVDGNFAVVRYLTDGQPDPSFGQNGVVVTDQPEHEYLRALVLAPGGKVVLGGIVYQNPFRFRLERYLPDGNLDTSFGGTGIVSTSIGTDAYGTGLAAENGKLVAGGWAWESEPRFALARYDDNGTLDHSFGNDGTRTYPVATAEKTSVVFQGSGAGRIVEVGTTYEQGRGQMAAIGVLGGEAGPPPPPLPPPPPSPPPPAPPARCVVPRVVGRTLSRAEARIRRANCSVGRVRRASSAKRRGLVIHQRPRARTRLRKGAPVQLVVSRGRH